MGLHHEITGLTPFDTEMRRSLWQTIRFVDVFVAIDRATEVLIAFGTWTTQPPHNVNDSEYNEASTSIPDHDTGLTDMSFALLASEACNTTQRLNTPEANPSGDTWQLRLDIAHNFGKHVQDKYLQYCDPSVPFHRLLSAVGKSMSAGMILRAVRPMMRHVSSVPPRIDSPYVLQIAMDALLENESIYEDPEAERWRWLVWVQWHPLAVALAGLCSIRGTDLAEKAWAVVEKSYDRHSRHVADTRNGMLWRPIEKLAKKANAFRIAGRRESQTLPLRQQQTLAPMPAISMPITACPPQAQQAQVNQHGMPVESMPMDPIMSGQLDFGSTDGFDMMSLQPGDAGWLDWEKIMDDFSDMPLNLDMGDIPQPQGVQDGHLGLLHDDLL